MTHRLINYCRRCGSAVTYRIPDDGDTRERAVCPDCGEIHYVNPLVVVGTIPTWDQRILLCRRAIEPRKDKWTLPAGFMELDETLAEGAARETVEEAGADFEMGPLFSILSVPRVGQVHAFFRARLRHPALHPGIETLEARLFEVADIPWDELSFPTVAYTLKFFLADLERGTFGMHTHDIRKWAFP